ncbi:unnamed protein product [Diplocarpon coronariae]|uniref:Uncharacterized protein n=1 Tax=Diplocarpon coronariae TaxID=2795749 RepID=A0A218ZI70_9HELO|nr:hypothetical protein JHW43_002601 [Diplocarpon mali]OWP07303.1 hypothetical protein B2J93_3050 [Marssonina coronariae]
MNCIFTEELPAGQEGFPFPSIIPRTSSTSDFSKLLQQDGAGSIFRSRVRSQTNGSENSQILYMASPKFSRRSARKSLSSVGNQPERKFDGSSEEKEIARDEVSWNIIDQEIHEWQYVCQTGRPYWWSPESRYTRLKKLQPRRHGPGPGLWMEERDGHPKPGFADKRRAVSDNYFCDPNSVHDLAHLIAIQLLGACFTLPPDHIFGIPSPHYALHTYARLPDPRMISSLRMHTQFRYTPSFGHQARNPSPVQAWPRHYGASSPGLSYPATGIGESSAAVERPSRRRTVNTTDGSASGVSSESDKEATGLLAISATVGVDGYGSTRSAARNRTSKRPSNQRPHGRSYQRSSRSEWMLSFPEEASALQKRSKYSLEPVLRSEPHHVFIQPVRELVVKRWSNFKRRLSGSLHSSLPMKASEEQDSEHGSAVLSSDAKTRRLIAQERGDIHSSSISSTSPHYNTPNSRNASPSGQQKTDFSLPTFRLSNAKISESALAAADKRLAAAALQMTTSPRPSYTSPSDSSIQSPQSLSSLTPPLRPPVPIHSPSRFAPAVSKSISPRRNIKRKSMLSEMYTPDDIITGQPVSEGYALSAPASTVISPLELPPSRLRQGLSTASSPGQVATHQIRHHVSPRSNGQSTSAQEVASDQSRSLNNVISSWVPSNPVREQRPRLERMSTSGTQVFTPQDDGIELDGLPVGPGSHLWTDATRRERTYL